MPYVRGFLNIVSGEGGRPDNSLPGMEGPVDPGYGIGIERPDQGLPTPPPGVWPPPVPSHPIIIAPPGTPPGVIWPSPGRPNRPDNTLPGSGARPDNTLPGSQPGVDNTLPGSQPRPDHGLPSQTYWMLVYTPGHGWHYITVDPSLKPDNTLPANPAHPDQTLPPAAQPKR